MIYICDNALAWCHQHLEAFCGCLWGFAKWHQRDGGAVTGMPNQGPLVSGGFFFNLKKKKKGILKLNTKKREWCLTIKIDSRRMLTMRTVFRQHPLTVGIKEAFEKDEIENCK